MHVLITGANGFIGIHAARALLDRGHRVRGLVRPGASDGNTTLLREWGVDLVEGNFGNETDATRVCEDVEAVIHLIGSIRRPKDGTFEEMHRGNTQGLVAGARACGVRRVVYVSAPGASATAKSAYLRTKHEAEEILRASGMECVVLRVSLVVGRRVGERQAKLLQRMAHMASAKKKMPVLGDGSDVLQPIHVADLAEILCQALERPEVAGQVIGVGGPQALTMDEIARGVLTACGHPQKRLRHVPLRLAKVIAPVLERLMTEPPLEEAQVLALEETERVDFDHLARTFDVEFTPFEKSLSELLVG